MPEIDKQFQVGDIVEFRVNGYSYTATVIATPYDDCHTILIGWRPTDPRGSFGWITATSFAVDISDTYDVVGNFQNFTRAWWAEQKDLSLLERKNSSRYMRINQKTLRKRMRDQIAQEIYK